MKIFKSILGFTLGFVLVNTIVTYAQNLSVAQTDIYGVCWDQPAPDLTTAQSYTYQVSWDSAAPVNITPICTGTASPFKCQAPPPLIKTNGSHKFTVTANVVLIDGTLLSSTVSAVGTYNVVGQPSTPLNPRVAK